MFYKYYCILVIGFKNSAEFRFTPKTHYYLLGQYVKFTLGSYYVH